MGKQRRTGFVQEPKAILRVLGAEDLKQIRGGAFSIGLEEGAKKKATKKKVVKKKATTKEAF